MSNKICIRLVQYEFLRFRVYEILDFCWVPYFDPRSIQICSSESYESHGPIFDLFVYHSFLMFVGIEIGYYFLLPIGLPIGLPFHVECLFISDCWQIVFPSREIALLLVTSWCKRDGAYINQCLFDTSAIDS